MTVSAAQRLLHGRLTNGPDGTAGEAAMRPGIDRTAFGSIVIDGVAYDHDVIIRLDGHVSKRKKKLSKAVFGTSHTISLDEAQYVYEPGARQLIIGAGQSGMVMLSNEAAEYLAEKGCLVRLLPTPQAVQAWNSAEGATIGLFHVTC
jgi:hypothetical protein